jgi:hypothetical protein
VSIWTKDTDDSVIERRAGEGEIVGAGDVEGVMDVVAEVDLVADRVGERLSETEIVGDAELVRLVERELDDVGELEGNMNVDTEGVAEKSTKKGQVRVRKCKITNV